MIQCNSNSQQPGTKDIITDTVVVDTVVAEIEEPNLVIPKDTIHDVMARFIAGIDLAGFHKGTQVDTAGWKAYAKGITENWDEMKKSRFDAMVKWVGDEVSPYIEDTMFLYYPFSGPDFLHAQYLFPEANDYLMLAKEGLGELPDMEKMEKAKLSSYLENINLFLRDIYKRSYFITGNMNDDMSSTSIKGILPIFYVFIARTGHEILDVERITLSPEGKIVMKGENKAKTALDGVRFYIRKLGEVRVKQLIYFDCDVSDDGFVKTPELLTYLKNLRNCNTFVKSASYLMHYGTFSEIRNNVLDRSVSILEDDTGIPYKYFKKDSWTFRLFGGYTKPISDFSENLWQKDLDAAYKDSTQYAGKLPFSLGYHWRVGEQNYMLMLKK